METLVEIRSPIRVKDLEGKAGVAFKALLGLEGIKKELYDSDRLLIINLKKGECIAFLDRDTTSGSFLEAVGDGIICAGSGSDSYSNQKDFKWFHTEKRNRLRKSFFSAS